MTKPTAREKSEKAIQREIRKRLGLRQDVWLERRPGGLLKGRGRSVVRLGLTGVPDLTGTLTIELGGYTLGLWLGIEVKKPRKKLRKHQALFRAAILKRGGIHIVAHSADEAVLMLNWAQTQLTSLLAVAA